MEDENTRMAAMKAKFEKEIAQLREDFTSMLRVEEAANKRMREAAAKREAANRESEAKLERSRKERSLGTPFAGQGGGMQLIVEELLFWLWAPCGHVG